MATKDTASVVVTWNHGADTVIDNFNPQSDTIFIDWFGPDEITVTEANGNVIFSIPSNQQTITLTDTGLADLTPDNFTIMSAATETKVLEMIKQSTPPDTDDTTDNGNNSGSGQTDAPAPDEPIVAGYFQSTDIYVEGRNYQLEDVPVDNLTHLFYAFVTVDESYEVIYYDEWGSIKKPFEDHDSVDGVGDTPDQEIKGNFNQMAELKEAHPDLKLIISIGGAEKLSNNFSPMAANEENREIFVNSVIEFLKKYPMFDGIDLDWEFPKDATDGENYALLVADLRKAIDDLGEITGNNYSISVASPSGQFYLSDFNIGELAPNVNFFNMMAYDMHGYWSDDTGHQAPMIDTKGGTGSVADAVDLYEEYGVPLNKIVLGAPTYTKAWKGVDANDPESAVNSSSDGEADGGNIDYRDMLVQLEDPDSGWKLYYDDDAQAAYVWNAEEKVFSTFETPETIALKSEWAKDKGLAGMMFWALGSDAAEGQESLLEAAADSWLHGKSFEEIANASQLEFEAVFGGDGEVAPFWKEDPDKVVVTWDWGQQDVYNNFDPNIDILEFNENIASRHLTIEEVDDDLLITVLNNNDHTILLEGIQAEDLSLTNLINADDGMIDQLQSLGMEDTIL